ncbi:unnamed protein product [Vicia faba]|uniref:Uncharacterized protein n=1 Tax=Vicia faba TaxID=3906 RepID=A0AAV1A687_VICFA|nr:unnamed protein product [Vicia faba]
MCARSWLWSTENSGGMSSKLSNDYTTLLDEIEPDEEVSSIVAQNPATASYSMLFNRPICVKCEPTQIRRFPLNKDHCGWSYAAFTVQLNAIIDAKFSK